MSKSHAAGLESAGTERSTDPVEELEFSPDTGRRAVYEAFRFERAGDVVRVWNESHGEHAADEHVYTVELDDRDVPQRCTCPAYEYHCAPGEMCKHGVSVALHLPEIEDHAIVTDGGVEVLDDADADPWTGPFAEYDKYGELTGARYYRCRDCGVEVHEDIDREHVRHRDGCRHSDDGRREPTRSEPADFGGGDSTGVQDL